MSKFVELGDEAFGGDMAGNQNVRRPQQQQQQQPYQQPHQQYQSPRAPPTVKFLDGSGSEEEEDAISLEEIEAPQSHNAKKHGSGGPRSAGADFRQKSARIGVEAKNYVEKKKTDFQVFSLEEFSADKRRVVG